MRNLSASWLAAWASQRQPEVAAARDTARKPWRSSGSGGTAGRAAWRCRRDAGGAISSRGREARVLGSFTAVRQGYGRRRRCCAIRRGRACPGAARGRSLRPASQAMPTPLVAPAAWVMPWRRVLRRIWKAARAMSSTACLAAASSTPRAAEPDHAGVNRRRRVEAAPGPRRGGVRRWRRCAPRPWPGSRPPGSAASRAATSRWTRNTPRRGVSRHLEEAGQQGRGDAVGDVAGGEPAVPEAQRRHGRRAAHRPAPPRHWRDPRWVVRVAATQRSSRSTATTRRARCGQLAGERADPGSDLEHVVVGARCPARRRCRRGPARSTRKF